VRYTNPRHQAHNSCPYVARLALRVGCSAGRWSAGKTIWAGFAGYSDLAAAPDGDGESASGRFSVNRPLPAEYTGVYMALPYRRCVRITSPSL
jgi:hypothetical protein